MTEKPKSNAGRKPLDDKVTPIKIYPRQSRIDTLTKETCQNLAVEAIEKAYKKTLKEKKV